MRHGFPHKKLTMSSGLMTDEMADGDTSVGSTPSSRDSWPKPPDIGSMADE
jgi:hypothetical protein